MNREFVPYEVALELKELGFDEPCFGNWQDMKEETPWFSKSYADNQNQYYGQLCSAPTFSQAFRFFREIENDWAIESWIQPHLSKEHRKYESFYWRRGETLSVGVFNTHEEAELGLLKKLIEIVKQ